METKIWVLLKSVDESLKSDELIAGAMLAEISLLIQSRFLLTRG